MANTETDRERYEELLQERVMLPGVEVFLEVLLTRVRIATRFQIFASVTMGISMCVALLVVVRFVFETAVGFSVAGALAMVWAGLWYVFPLQLRRRWG